MAARAHGYAGNPPVSETVLPGALPAKRARGPVAARSRQRFLEALASGCTVEEAATAAGRSKQTFYRLRASDQEFEVEWRAAMWERAEPIERAMERAAIDGWDEFVYDGDGKLIRREHKWSPRPGEVMLKTSRPDLYREGVNVEVNVPAVFVLESAFAGRRPIEAEVIESTALELTEGGTS